MKNGFSGLCKLSFTHFQNSQWPWMMCKNVGEREIYGPCCVLLTTPAMRVRPKHPLGRRRTNEARRLPIDQKGATRALTRAAILVKKEKRSQMHEVCQAHSPSGQTRGSALLDMCRRPSLMKLPRTVRIAAKSAARYWGHSCCKCGMRTAVWLAERRDNQSSGPFRVFQRKKHSRPLH